MKFIFSILFLSISSSYASVPDNALKFPMLGNKLKSFKSMPMELMRFQKVIEHFENTWIDILREEYSKKLIINIDLEDERVNASCSRDDDNNPILKIRGGLLRHPEMNEEVLNFLLCHELGHFMGGAPKSFRGRSSKRSWSSVEGQADYFAATKCLPKLYSQEIMGLDFSKSTLIKDRVKSVCEGEVCSRVVYSGLLATRFFASLKRGSTLPEIGNNERHYPSATLQRHPSPQCRLDTIVSAVKCDVDYSYLMDDFDISIGACIKKDVNLAGERASCWFNEMNY
jgi:hypothetical protein